MVFNLRTQVISVGSARSEEGMGPFLRHAICCTVLSWDGILAKHPKRKGQLLFPWEPGGFQHVPTGRRVWLPIKKDATLGTHDTPQDACGGVFLVRSPPVFVV